MIEKKSPHWWVIWCRGGAGIRQFLACPGRRSLQRCWDDAAGSETAGLLRQAERRQKSQGATHERPVFTFLHWWRGGSHWSHWSLQQYPRARSARHRAAVLHWRWGCAWDELALTCLDSNNWRKRMKKDEKRYFARLFISLAVIIHVIMDFHGFSMK